MDETGTRLLRGGLRRGRAALGVAAAALLTLTAACSEPESDGPSGDVHPGGPAASSPASSPSSPSSAAGDAVVDWTRVAAQVEPSVVSISVTGERGSGQGSGVIIDTEGHVLTNDHVIAPAVPRGRLQVSLADSSVFDAELVGHDPTTDLAVLKISEPPADVAALRFGDSEAVRVGQPVMALGNPLGLSHTVTLGIVSPLDRPVITGGAAGVPGVGTPVVTNAIQTDAAVNPGNSGGALVDADGQLIGINSSIATLGASHGGPGGSIGLGFAIPASQARWVAEELIESGRVRHAYLGVSTRDVVVSIDGVKHEGAGVTAVASDTPAARTELRSGDVIIQVDDEIVAGAESLVAQIRERPPGTEVELTVVSGTAPARKVTVEFGTRPVP